MTVLVPLIYGIFICKLIQETGKPGNRENGKPGKRETGKPGSRENVKPGSRVAGKT
jgi:hypothetical protein